MQILITGHKGFIASHHPNLEFDGVGLGEEIPEKEYDVIIHLASFMRDEPNLLENNIEITKKILKPESHIIFTSSAAVYGDADSFPITEDEPLRPINVYGESKVICEKLVREMPKHTILRLSNVYPKEDSAWGIFKNGGKIYGDGKQIRDFIHVEDVWKGIVQSIVEKRYGTFNLSSGKGVTLNKFYRDNFHKEPEYMESPYKEIQISILSNKKFMKGKN